MYILSILAAAEAKKTVISKHISQSAIVRLDTDDPWDTMKAQILVKIDQALHPSRIQYDDYDIKFYITCVLPKPGLSLVSETDYEVMMLKARKLKGSDPEINITVTQTHSDGNKENEAAIEELDQDATKKSRCVMIFCGTQKECSLCILQVGQEGPCYPARKRQQESAHSGSAR